MLRRVLVFATALPFALLAASPAGAAVRLPGELLPDGETRPVVEAVELRAPESRNDLLEADLRIAVDTDLGIRRYEYRWNRGTPGAVQRTSVVNPTVSYATILPDTPYTLEVRAVDRHGRESSWFRAWEGRTPPRPLVVVAGDSVASGYSRQWFTGDAVCRDDDYSYGSTVQRTIASQLPTAWTPRYVNIAYPGAGVGDVLGGGSDSCSAGHPSQVDDIARLADPSTWNIVVMTAGINSTNWVDVITGLTRDTLFSLTDSGDKKACQRAVNEEWDLDERREFITDTASRIVDEITSRTNADVYWTSYYQLAGTRFAPLWSPVGGECEDEMNLALDQLHEAIRAGLTGDVVWVDLGGQTITTQKWAGWPHPNPEGHVAIGTTIASSITG
jgi:hypothetical protein